MHLRDYLYLTEMTQIDFAKKIGISRTHMAMIVLGKNRPSPELAKKIIDATEGKVTLSELFFPDEHAKLSIDEIPQ